MGGRLEYFLGEGELSDSNAARCSKIDRKYSILVK